MCCEVTYSFSPELLDPYQQTNQLRVTKSRGLRKAKAHISSGLNNFYDTYGCNVKAVRYKFHMGVCISSRI